MASVANQFKIGDIEYAVAASAYGECSTAAGTAAKAVTICTDGDTTNTAFTLIKGVSVQVKFTVTNTAASPTLNVNGSGAKAIYYNGAAITAGYLKVNKVYQFVYNGTQWDLVGDVDTNADIQVRVYRQDGSSYNADYPLIASRTKAADLGTVGTESSNEAVYGLISDTDANIPTTNPYTGMTKVKNLTVSGTITGGVTTASATLSASSWSSGAYTYSNTAITADSIIEIIPATSITAAQLKAFQLANVVGTAQAAGSVTMTAFGTIPTVNIPVVFIIRG